MTVVWCVALCMNSFVCSLLRGSGSIRTLHTALIYMIKVYTVVLGLLASLHTLQSLTWSQYWNCWVSCTNCHWNSLEPPQHYYFNHVSTLWVCCESAYSCFRVSSPILTLHTAVTHMIKALELPSLTCYLPLALSWGSAVPMLQSNE